MGGKGSKGGREPARFRGGSVDLGAPEPVLGSPKKTPDRLRVRSAGLAALISGGLTSA